MKFNLQNRQGGFTLIELLIVVAIIGILAALAVPSYINYLKKTRTNECVTALGSIRDMQTTYVDDEFMGGGTNYAPDLATLHWTMKGGLTKGKYFTYGTTASSAACVAIDVDKVSHATVQLVYRLPTDAASTDKLLFKTN